MKFPTMNPPTRAAIAAVVLFGLGALTGITADRWWNERTSMVSEAGQLTVPAMAQALDLDSAQQARVADLLQELEVQVIQASREGPAALQQAARDARQRLEEEIPADRRERFRSWMGEHRDWMMDQMCDDEMEDSGWRNNENMNRWRRWED